MMLPTAPGLGSLRLSPRARVQCRVARPGSAAAVLDRPTQAEAAAAPAPDAQAPPSDASAPRAPRRRGRRPPATGSDDGERPPRSSSSTTRAPRPPREQSADQSSHQAPIFTPVESATSLILRGLRGGAASAADEQNEGGAPSAPSASVPLAVEGGAEGLAVAVLALSRAQHALRTERGLELAITGASTQRRNVPLPTLPPRNNARSGGGEEESGGGGGGDGEEESGGGGGGGGGGARPPLRTRAQTSLRARLTAAPAAPPTDRPVRRVDVLPGTPRNAVVAAAVAALRAGGSAPVDLVARGPRAASNALAALGLVRATFLRGSAEFSPAPFRGRRRDGEADGEAESAAAAPAPAAAAAARAFPPLDVVAVLDALPPARPASPEATATPAAPAPHELVIRLRLSTCPPPSRKESRAEREADGAAAAAPRADADADAEKARRNAARRERSDKKAAAAELRAAVAAAAAAEGGSPSSSSGPSVPPPSAALQRELSELAERVRDLTEMNATILEMLERDKRAEQRP